MNDKKEEKKPDGMSEEVWTEFKRLRALFIDTFEGYPVEDINNVLENHPNNFRSQGEDEPDVKIVLWQHCPLWTTAAYYASNKLGLHSIAMIEKEELKNLLDK